MSEDNGSGMDTKLSLTAVISIVLNVGALVWGAGKITQSVEMLSKTVQELSIAVKHIEERINVNTVEIEVLKSRIPSAGTRDRR